MGEQREGGRRHRRAVGPPGARPAQDEPQGLPGVLSAPEPQDRPDDDERLRADRPPHHDRGV